jgi:hypothetical protein
MIKRKLLQVINSRLLNYPAVALLGARQSGKTTLAKTLSDAYYDLELEEDKLRLDLQWNDIRTSDKLVILDEAQNFPEIFPRVRAAIDQNRQKNGRFMILGSVSPALMTKVSESLTGRIAVCELAPFSITELDLENELELWLMGGYPDGGILSKSNFYDWQTHYLDLLAMRDLPNWGIPSKPQVTKRLFKMLAATHGHIWNASHIGKSLGLSYHTVNSYLDYFEQAFLIRRVQPFFVNIRKRLVKSPKIYWRDSGLLHSLLNIDSMDSLINHPQVGFSWEGWVIEQVITFLDINGIIHSEPYYFRTSDGYELDLVMIIRDTLWAIEIKLTTNPTSEDYTKLRKAAALIDAQKMALLSKINEPTVSQDTFSGGLRAFLDYVADG